MKRSAEHKIMRLFKSRKSGEYSDVSSVVANENDPHVKIVSCNSQQEFHNTDQHDNGDKQLAESENSSSNCLFALDDHKKHPNSINQTHCQSNQHHHDISYHLKQNDSGCTDKFTPIPDCDKIDQPIATHYETSSASTHDNHIEYNSTSTATQQDSTHHLHSSSDSTSDFINELFGIFNHCSFSHINIIYFIMHFTHFSLSQSNSFGKYISRKNHFFHSIF